MRNINQLESLKAQFRRLDHYVLERGSPATICLMRIAFGSFLCVQLSLFLIRFDIWFSNAGWLSSKCFDLSYTPNFSLLNGVRSDTAVFVFLLVTLAAAVFMTVGLFSRVSTAVVWIGLTSIQARFWVILCGGDIVVQMMLLYLCFAETGARYSLDRLLEGKRSQSSGEISLWPQKLIQIQIALIYLSAFLYKLADQCWTNGSALYYGLHYMGLQNFWMPEAFQHPPLTNIGTYLSLIVEGSLSILPFFRRYRVPVLILGTLFHFAIGYSMRIPFFGPACVISYLSFFKGEEITEFIRRVSVKPKIIFGYFTEDRP